MNLADLTGLVEKPIAAVCLRNRAVSTFEDSSAAKGDESNSSATNFDDRSETFVRATRGIHW
jgi:hypothetical protein